VVEHVTAVTDEVVDALRRLLPALSPSATPPDTDHVRRIVESPATTLFVARDASGRIVGTLTLALFELPSGVRAWIEDVVVADEARGRRIGSALTQEAIRVAGERGARTIELTSRPSRAAANRMYRRLGFVERGTNVYRYTIGAS
jgi:ribosomal protein S18 acetylase RimI-like enzyme